MTQVADFLLLNHERRNLGKKLSQKGTEVPHNLT